MKPGHIMLIVAAIGGVCLMLCCGGVLLLGIFSIPVQVQQKPPAPTSAVETMPMPPAPLTEPETTESESAVPPPPTP